MLSTSKANAILCNMVSTERVFRLGMVHVSVFQRFFLICRRLGIGSQKGLMPRGISCTIHSGLVDNHWEYHDESTIQEAQPFWCSQTCVVGWAGQIRYAILLVYCSTTWVEPERYSHVTTIPLWRLWGVTGVTFLLDLLWIDSTVVNCWLNL